MWSSGGNAAAAWDTIFKVHPLEGWSKDNLPGFMAWIYRGKTSSHSINKQDVTMKKWIALVLAGCFLLPFCGCMPQRNTITVEINGSDREINSFEEIEKSFLNLLDAAGWQNVELYDCSELTVDILENRKGTTVVERCIGLVTDKEAGDGMILNLPEDCGYYIGYRNIYLPIAEGTVMLSYMVYNPKSNYIDDIIERYDFVLDREWED